MAVVTSGFVIMILISQYIHIYNFGLLVDRTSSIYLQVRLKNLTSVIFFLVFENILYKLCLIGVYEKVYKQRGTVCSHKDADDLLKDVRSELDQYMYVNKRFNV